MSSFGGMIGAGGTFVSASFPSLFAIVEYKDAWVKDFWSGPVDGEG